MKSLLIAGSIVLAIAGNALADETAISDDEIAQLKKVLEAWGCSGGEIEKESAGMYEIDDAMCAAGEYDFHVNADFHAVVIVQH